MSYGLAKLLHLITVILWIGPALGAYYFVWRVQKENDPDRALWVEKTAERVLVFEHLALAGMIGTGIWMLAASGWSMARAAWLQNKLYLFCAVLVFEAFDIYVAHGLFHRLVNSGAKPGGKEWEEAEKVRKILLWMALPIGTFVIPAIFYFAVLKP